MRGTLTITAGGVSGAADAEGGADAAGDPHAGHQMSAGDYERMSDAMNATMAAYPAETEGTGNQVLEPTVRAGGVKEFELTAAVSPWEVEPGSTVEAWTYNGMVPGPQIRLDVGDRVRLVLHNELPMGTDLHLHGIKLDPSMDGSPR
jgi:FtsP/CotA-like multicopper oxidase with cupredoxin domain